MKVKIHPAYTTEATVTCSCGNTFKTGSVKENITVEVCYKCHPFYTGEQRFLDTRVTVDKFKRKMEVAKEYQAKNAHKKNKKEDKTDKQAKSLRELLAEV
jgi:large subunit ribosomal protein L31